MQKTFYNEVQIEELKQKYRWYRWGRILCIILPLVLCLIANHTNLDFLNGYYGYYNFDGAYCYFCNTIYYIILYIGPFFIAFSVIIYDLIIKLLLKDRYVEYEVAKKGGNVKQNKWENTLLVVSLIMLVALMIAILYNLPHIELKDTGLYIKQNNIAGVMYQYSELKSIQLDSDNLKFDIVLETQEGKHVFLDIGKRSTHQDEMLKVLDEKTGHRFELFENVNSVELDD